MTHLPEHPASATRTTPPAAAGTAAERAADPIAPAAGAKARVSPLAEVTLGAADLDAVARFYGEGLGMTCTRERLEGEPATAFRRHYRMAGEGPLELLSCTRPGLPGTPRVRAIALGADAPLARPGHDALLPGGLSLGFSSAGNAPLFARLGALGFRSTAGLTSITLPRGDGGSYSVGELHLLAPDGVYVLGIDRGDMAPLAPIDPVLGVGGPAYSGLVVADLPALSRLLGDVVGLEKRREVELGGPAVEEGLGLPPGTRFDFQQWFMPGGATGYVIVMHFKGQPGRPAAHLGPIARGLMMWTFEVEDLEDRAAAARAAGVSVVAGPADVPWPGGCRQSLVLATAEGFRVELAGRSAPSFA